jgi:hypothetical protein
MINQIKYFIYLLVAIALIQGCASMSMDVNDPKLRVYNSLSRGELDKFNDSFDTFDNSLWEKDLWLGNAKEIKGQVKFTDYKNEHGRLVLRTLPFEYSKGDLNSRFRLSGDFDIQVDFSVSFKKIKQNQAAVLWIAPEESGNAYYIEVSEVWYKGGGGFMEVYTGQGKNGKYRNVRKIRPISHFRGAHRIIRKGDTIYSFYKKNLNDPWRFNNKSKYLISDLNMGFSLKNFHSSSIVFPNTDFRAELILDNFRINGAQHIVQPKSASAPQTSSGNNQMTYTGSGKQGCMGNCQNGYGTFTFSNGDVYIGQWKDRKRHGQGIYNWHSGKTWKGEFRNNRRVTQ